MNKLHPLQQSLFPQNPLEPAQMLAPLTSGQLVLAIVVSFLEESFSTEYQTPPTDSLKNTFNYSWFHTLQRIRDDKAIQICRQNKTDTQFNITDNQHGKHLEYLYGV